MTGPPAIAGKILLLRCPFVHHLQPVDDEPSPPDINLCPPGAIRSATGGSGATLLCRLIVHGGTRTEGLSQTVVRVQDLQKVIHGKAFPR